MVGTSSKRGKFGFEVKFDLEGHGRSLHKTIGILTKIFYTFDPNLAILAWTGHELSREQANGWQTDLAHTRTDACNGNTGRPVMRK